MPRLVCERQSTTFVNERPPERDYTRWRRSGKARHPGPRRRCGRQAGHQSATAARQIHSRCAQLPPGCLIAMEASSSAHHWARKLTALGLDARIIAAHLVSPYRLQGKGGKNDANDAAAICEAASRPTMHFVPVKTIAQQGMLCVHRLHQPHPWPAGRIRRRGIAKPQGVARMRERDHRRCHQRTSRPGPPGDRARAHPVARTRRPHRLVR